MNRYYRIVYACLLAAACISQPALAESPPEKTALERSEALFQEGNRAFEEQRFSEALEAHREAWALHRSYRTAAALGQIELHLGRYREAAEHLAYSREHYPAGGDAGVRERIAAGLRQAREHVAALRVRVDVEGARVEVDGETVGEAPLDGLVFVEPGQHTVVAVSGDRRVERTVTAVRSGAREVVLELGRPPGADGLGAGAQVSPGSTDGSSVADRGSSGGLSTRAILLITGAGLTVGGIATTVAFDLKGARADDDMKHLRSRLANQTAACSAPAAVRPDECNDLARAADDRHRANRIATIAAATTGVVGAATVVGCVLWCFDDDELPGEDTGFRLSPSIDPTGAALFVDGAF